MKAILAVLALVMLTGCVTAKRAWDTVSLIAYPIAVTRLATGYLIDETHPVYGYACDAYIAPCSGKTWMGHRTVVSPPYDPTAAAIDRLNSTLYWQGLNAPAYGLNNRLRENAIMNSQNQIYQSNIDYYSNTDPFRR